MNDSTCRERFCLGPIRGHEGAGACLLVEHCQDAIWYVVVRVNACLMARGYAKVDICSRGPETLEEFSVCVGEAVLPAGFRLND